MAALIFSAVLYFIFGVAGINGQEEFIVGGANAYNGQVPYQTSLRDANNQHTCGGTIIAPRWILTAAHCISSGSPAAVIVGTVYLNSGGDKYIVEKSIKHESYDSNTYENDIALVKTTKPIVFNDYVKPAATPAFSIGENVKLLASGWGLTSTSGTSPNNLQVLSTTTITNQKCEEKIGQAGKVFRTSLCTYNSTGYGMCQGDSGGPLVRDWIVHGIVSWVLPCAVGYPDGNTRVQSYKSWLRNTLENN